LALHAHGSLKATRRRAEGATKRGARGAKRGRGEQKVARESERGAGGANGVPGGQ
jgi:hypothetical protein